MLKTIYEKKANHKNIIRYMYHDNK